MKKCLKTTQFLKLFTMSLGFAGITGCQNSKISLAAPEAAPEAPEVAKPDPEVLLMAARIIHAKQDLFTQYQVSVDSKHYESFNLKGDLLESSESAFIAGPEDFLGGVSKPILLSKQVADRINQIQNNLDLLSIEIDSFFSRLNSLEEGVRAITTEALDFKTIEIFQKEKILFKNLKLTLVERENFDQALKLEAKIRALKIQIISPDLNQNFYLIDKAYLLDKPLQESEIARLNEIQVGIEDYQLIIKKNIDASKLVKINRLNEMLKNLRAQERSNNANQVSLFIIQRLGESTKSFLEAVRSLQKKGLFLDDNPEGAYLTNSKTALFGWSPALLNFNEIDLSSNGRDQIESLKGDLQKIIDLAPTLFEDQDGQSNSEGEKYYRLEMQKQINAAKQAYDCVEFKLALNEVIKLEKNLGQIGVMISIYNESELVEVRLAPSVDAKTVHTKLKEIKTAIQNTLLSNNHSLNLGRSKKLLKAELEFINEEIERLQKTNSFLEPL